MYWRSQSINDVKIVFQTFGYGDLNLLERLSSASNQIVHIQYSIIVFCVAHLFAYRTFLTSTTEFWVSLSIIQLTESKKPNNTLYQQLYNAEASDCLELYQQKQHFSTATVILSHYPWLLVHLMLKSNWKGHFLDGIHAYTLPQKYLIEL